MGDDLDNLAAAVKSARLALPGAPTQQDMARRAGMSDTTWNLAENAKPVGKRSLALIADALGWPADLPQRLLDGEGYPPGPEPEAATEPDLLAAVRELTEAVRELRADLREGRR